MKREDLIKKLEDIEIPNADLPSYKNRLKMALYDADNLNKRQCRATILEMAKSKIKRMKDTLLKGLISRQPVWKAVAVSVMALALVLGLSLTIPPLTTDSVYAQAEKIAKNSPEVLTAVGEVSEVQVIDISGIEGTVIAQGETNSVVAKVNLETKEVTEMADFVIDDQIAIKIAKADPRVRALLDAGAIISEAPTFTFAISGYIYVFTGNVATAEPEFEESLGVSALVKIIDSANVYSVYVDMIEGKVTSIKTTSVRAAAIEIAKADPQVRALLDAGAIISKTPYTISSALYQVFPGNVATGEPEFKELLEVSVLVEIVDSTDVYSAHVNLIEGKVTSIEVTSVTAAAIEIAKADPRVRALLDAGATISEGPTFTFTMYVYHGVFPGDAATGEPEFEPELEEFLGVCVQVKIVDSENIYSALVDMIEGKVTRITEAPLDADGNPPLTTIVFP